MVEERRLSGGLPRRSAYDRSCGLASIAPLAPREGAPYGLAGQAILPDRPPAHIPNLRPSA